MNKPTKTTVKWPFKTWFFEWQAFKLRSNTQKVSEPRRVKGSRGWQWPKSPNVSLPEELTYFQENIDILSILSLFVCLFVSRVSVSLLPDKHVRTCSIPQSCESPLRTPLRGYGSETWATIHFTGSLKQDWSIPVPLTPYKQMVWRLGCEGAYEFGQPRYSDIKNIYCTHAVITRSWFKTALDYKPRILGPTFLVYVLN